jgi:glycosyltransferase involved in cell wall biosynthesis
MGKSIVVHLHGYIPLSYTATILAPYEEHKHGITRDDVKLVCMKGPKYCPRVLLLWWLPRLAKKWIMQADRVLCVSKRQAEIILDQIPELGDKMEVVYNPIPPELLNNEPVKEPNDTPTFLYVGGDSYVKGFQVLLQALNELGKWEVKARFIFTNKYSLRNIQILKKTKREA